MSYRCDFSSIIGSVLGQFLTDWPALSHHLNNLTILRRFSWLSLACMCTKAAIHFVSFHFTSILDSTAMHFTPFYIHLVINASPLYILAYLRSSRHKLLFKYIYIKSYQYDVSLYGGPYCPCVAWCRRPGSCRCISSPSH